LTYRATLFFGNLLQPGRTKKEGQSGEVKREESGRRKGGRGGKKKIQKKNAEKKFTNRGSAFCGFDVESGRGLVVALALEGEEEPHPIVLFSIFFFFQSKNHPHERLKIRRMISHRHDRHEVNTGKVQNKAGNGKKEEKCCKKRSKI
jgi:hypothetical protein